MKRRTNQEPQRGGTKKHKKNKKQDDKKKRRKQPKHKAKKSKKKKRSSSSSSSSSDSDSESSSSSSSSSESSADTISVSSGGEDGGNARKKKQKARILNQIWEKEKRPEGLRSTKDLEQFTSTEIRDFFDMQKSKEKAEKQATYETMQKDTKLPKKKYKGGKDDATKVFHPARWERLPVVHPKKYWANIPMTRSVVYRNMETAFHGFSGKIADKTITSMHDRSIPLQMKHFLAENATVATKPRKEVKKLDDDGMATIIDFMWEAASSMQQVQEGVNSYTFLLHMLWPFDPTGIIINNLMTKYKWASMATDLKTRQNIVVGYFNSVLRTNASRASNRSVVMGYQEHETLLKDTMLKNQVSPEIPLFGQKQFLTGASNNPKSGATGFQNKFPKQTTNKKFASVGGTPCCFVYNSMESGRSCRNTPSGSGCKDAQGRTFAHACSFWVPARNRHCLGRHRRRDHR